MDNYAVVILNYNGVDHLKKFLPSVLEHSGTGQIVVVDNGSQDNSLEYLKNHHPEVQIITLDANYGFSGGYNRGLSQVEAGIYFLVNSDVEVTPNWTEPILEYLQTNPEVGICQPKILSYPHKQRFDYAGAAGGFMDLLGYPFCRGRVFDHLEQDTGQYNDKRRIFWAGGACLAIRSELYHALGGFDVDFFAHMEEIDLCWRCQLLGNDIAYIGTSTVYHLGGGTLSDTNPHKTFLNFRNALCLLVKNGDSTELLWKVPLRLILDGVAAMHFLVNGSVKHCFAVIRADLSFLGNLPRTWRKRTWQNKRSTGLLYNKSIVWQYFVKGKRTFTEIQSEN